MSPDIIITLPFSKYGHGCGLENLSFEKYNDNDNNFPDKGWFKNIYSQIIRLCVVSETSKIYTLHLRSFGAIVKERQRQILNYHFRIHPFSKAIIFISMVLTIATFMELLCNGLAFLFHDIKSFFKYNMPFIICRYLLSLIFFINVILNFFIGYYDEPNQIIVLDAKKIAIRYLKTYFIIDILVSIPSDLFNLIFFFWDSHTVELINCLKFLVIVRFYKSVKYCAEVLGINYYTYKVSLIIIFTLLYWYIACCVTMYLRLYVSSDTDNVVFHGARTLHHSFGSEIKKKYPEIIAAISTFYRGSLIVYNSSYGKQLPSTKLEILVIWFGWYASTVFFIYILAIIMEIMNGQTSATHKYAEVETQLKDYMCHKQLPLLLRNRILTYYEFRFQKSYFAENEILNTVTEQLKQNINMHACRKLVENVIFFKSLPLNVLIGIISCLKLEVYLINDIIIKANTPGTKMYFVASGSVAIYTKSGKEICHLEDGSHFGEVAIIMEDTLRTATVVAAEVSEVYWLDQKDFFKAINPYPDLIANIQHIATERMEVASMLDVYDKQEFLTKKWKLDF